RRIKIDLRLLVGVQDRVELDLAVEARAALRGAGPVRNGAEPENLPPVLIRREEVVFPQERALVVSDLGQISQVGPEAIGDVTQIELDVVVAPGAGVI